MAKTEYIDEDGFARVYADSKKDIREYMAESSAILQARGATPESHCQQVANTTLKTLVGNVRGDFCPLIKALSETELQQVRKALQILRGIKLNHAEDELTRRKAQSLHAAEQSRNNPIKLLLTKCLERIHQREAKSSRENVLNEMKCMIAEKHPLAGIVSKIDYSEKSILFTQGIESLNFDSLSRRLTYLKKALR